MQYIHTKYVVAIARLTWSIDVNAFSRSLDEINVSFDGIVGGEERRHGARLCAVCGRETSVVRCRLVIVAVGARSTEEQELRMHACGHKVNAAYG